jgi:hypothetical protein
MSDSKSFDSTIKPGHRVTNLRNSRLDAVKKNFAIAIQRVMEPQNLNRGSRLKAGVKTKSS